MGNSVFLVGGLQVNSDVDARLATAGSKGTVGYCRCKEHKRVGQWDTETKDEEVKERNERRPLEMIRLW
jgi:hypothetical protein